MNVLGIQKVYADLITDRITGLNGYSYVETLFEDTEGFAGYNAPAALVVCPSFTPLPEGVATIFDCVINWACVVVVEDGSAEDCYSQGWGFAEQVAALFNGNQPIRSSQTGSIKIDGVTRQERLDKEGFPLGTYYWIILFSQYYKYDNR